MLDNKRFCIDFVSRETGEVHAGFGKKLIDAIRDLGVVMGKECSATCHIKEDSTHYDIRFDGVGSVGDTLEQSINDLGKSMGYEVFIKEKAEGWKK